MSTKLLLSSYHFSYPHLDYDLVELRGKILYVCKACHDRRPREPFNCKAHDESQVHKGAIAAFNKGPGSPAPSDDDNCRNPSQLESQVPTHDLLTEDALCALVVSLTTQPSQPSHPSGHPLIYAEPNFPTSPRSPGPFPTTGVNWELYETLEDMVAEQPFEVQLTEDIAQATLDFLNGSDSDFDAC